MVSKMVILNHSQKLTNFPLFVVRFDIFWTKVDIWTKKNIFFIYIGGRRVPPGEPERDFKKRKGAKLESVVAWHVGCLLIGILVNGTLLMSNLVFESILTHREEPWGFQEEDRGPKFKLMDMLHVGCLFTGILVKKAVFDVNSNFWTNNKPQGRPHGVLTVD